MFIVALLLWGNHEGRGGKGISLIDYPQHSRGLLHCHGIVWPFYCRVLTRSYTEEQRLRCYLSAMAPGHRRSDIKKLQARNIKEAIEASLAARSRCTIYHTHTYTRAHETVRKITHGDGLLLGDPFILRNMRRSWWKAIQSDAILPSGYQSIVERTSNVNVVSN